MDKKVIVLGSGGHAKVVIDILHGMNNITIHGITSKSLMYGDYFFGYPVLGDDLVLNNFNPSEYVLAMGLGGYRDNDLREQVYRFGKGLGFDYINAIHPGAVISETVKFGESITIFPGVVLNTDVQINDNSIVATSSSIDHETIIGRNVLVSAGVTIGAYTVIMDNALIALGAKIISGIKIGKRALVAAGAVVVSDVPDNAIVYGVPAKSKN